MIDRPEFTVCACTRIIRLVRPGGPLPPFYAHSTPQGHRAVPADPQAIDATFHLTGRPGWTAGPGPCAHAKGRHRGSGEEGRRRPWITYADLQGESRCPWIIRGDRTMTMGDDYATGHTGKEPPPMATMTFPPPGVTVTGTGKMEHVDFAELVMHLKATGAFAPAVRPAPLGRPSLDVYPAVLELDIIASDIAQGLRGAPSACAAALAARRRFDGAGANVNRAGLHVYPGDEGLIVYRPRGDGLAQWIARFDSGRKVKPVRFVFDRVV